MGEDALIDSVCFEKLLGGTYDGPAVPTPFAYLRERVGTRSRAVVAQVGPTTSIRVKHSVSIRQTLKLITLSGQKWGRQGCTAREVDKRDSGL